MVAGISSGRIRAREEVGDAEGVEKRVMEWQRFGHTQLGALPFHRLPPSEFWQGERLWLKVAAGKAQGLAEHLSKPTDARTCAAKNVFVWMDSK